MTVFLNKGIRQARRLAIALLGSAVLLIGAAMIILPGPAIIVIPLGLGILATEFAWARNLKQQIKNKCRKVQERGNCHEEAK
jgi:tellurite resistance protein TerC